VGFFSVLNPPSFLKEIKKNSTFAPDKIDV